MDQSKKGEQEYFDDLKHLLGRVLEHEKYRSEGVEMFKNVLVILDSITDGLTQEQKSAMCSLIKEQIGSYIENIAEYNQKQDEVYDKLFEISAMNSFLN